MKATCCPVYGEWYSRFMQGLHERTGDDVRPDLGVSIEVLHECLKRLDKRYLESTIPKEKETCANLGFFMSVGFCAALRGEEIVKVDLYNLALHCVDALEHRTPFVPVALLGKFKGETGTRHHIIPVAATTASGIECSRWTTRIIESRRDRHIRRGWLYQDEEGKWLKASSLEEEMMQLLESV